MVPSAPVVCGMVLPTFWRGDAVPKYGTPIAERGNDEERQAQFDSKKFNREILRSRRQRNAARVFLFVLSSLLDRMKLICRACSIVPHNSGRASRHRCKINRNSCNARYVAASHIRKTMRLDADLSVAGASIRCKRSETGVVTFAQRIAIDSAETQAATDFAALADLCYPQRWD